MTVRNSVSAHPTAPLEPQGSGIGCTLSRPVGVAEIGVTQ